MTHLIALAFDQWAPVVVEGFREDNSGWVVEGVHYSLTPLYPDGRPLNLAVSYNYHMRTRRDYYVQYLQWMRYLLDYLDGTTLNEGHTQGDPLDLVLVHGDGGAVVFLHFEKFHFRQKKWFRSKKPWWVKTTHPIITEKTVDYPRPAPPPQKEEPRPRTALEHVLEED